MSTISISKDFTTTPGGRYKKDGGYSGELFRETILIPRFISSKEKNEKLTIDFDGVYGYGISFLEEAFGGLARKYGKNEVLEILKFISNDEPSLVEDVKGYIIEAENK